MVLSLHHTILLIHLSSIKIDVKEEAKNTRKKSFINFANFLIVRKHFMSSRHYSY
jgi:hypothetical protein